MTHEHHTHLTTLNIATRQSPLALWQAEHIKNRLNALYPHLDINLIKMVTKGDKILDTPLAKIGGKGLFVKELEQALYSGEADIAVHSLKDVPMVLPEGLILGAYCKREEPTDAFVSHHFQCLDDLPENAVVGTSSLRRQCQIKAYRPDLQIKTLRGNVGTRLSKLDAGEYDAIILATSGLTRIGLQDRIRSRLSINVSLPAVGQGALAIECRDNDDAVKQLLAPLNDDNERICLIAERALNRHLDGGCQVPIAGYAILTPSHHLASHAIDNNTANDKNAIHHQGNTNDQENDTLWLRGRVGQPDGQSLLKAEAHFHLTGSQKDKEQQAEQLGIDVAKKLLSQGADEILKSIYQANH